jgi:hypothetical protein
VGINLSIYLCVAAIDITNVVGGGLMQLIVSPFDFDKIYVDGSAGNTAGVMAILSGALVGIIVFLGAGGAGGLLAIMLMLILTVMLLVLAIMITLALRQALLVLLTVLSPIAIALFILPNTEKYFRQWWDLFLKTLIIYPIIAALFAISGVMASISLSSTGDPDSGNIDGAFQIITALILVYMPLFMIPFAFKFAGGVLGGAMNVANGMRSNFGNWNKQRLERAAQTPDSTLAKSNRAISSWQKNRGLTARQIMARRPGGDDRAGRIRAARGLDLFQAKQQEMQADRFKSKAMDSDVMQSLVMSREAVDADRTRLRGVLASKTATQDQKLTAQRELQAHSDADSIGRTAATRRAAFANQDRIKFRGGEGEAGYNEDLAVAREIYGNDADVAEAMNEYQAVAKGVGRSDLAGNLYGRSYDAERTGGHLSASEVINGQPSGVSALIDEQVGVLRSNADYKDKVGAARRLADFRAAANSPYAKGAGKQAVLDKVQDMDSAFSDFAGDPSMQHQAELAEQGQLSVGGSGGTETVHEENIFKTTKQPSGETRTIKVDESTQVTQPIPRELSGTDAAKGWFEQQSGRSVDPSEAERAAKAAQGQQQKPEEEQ